MTKKNKHPALHAASDGAYVMDTEPYTPSPGAHFEEGLSATAAGVLFALWDHLGGRELPGTTYPTPCGARADSGTAPWERSTRWVILALKLHLGQLGLSRGLHCSLTLARDQSYFLRLCPQMSRAPLKNPLRGCFLETWPRNDSYPWFSPRPSAATKILGGQGQHKRKINAGGRRVKKKKNQSQVQMTKL